MEARASIYRNLAALKRIAFEFFAMAGFDGMNPPEPIARGKFGIARHVHNAVMALLRPAEAATRRLIIAMAREVQVKPPKPRPRPQRRRFVPRPRTATGEWLASTAQADRATRPIHHRFQLLDPRRRLNRPGKPWRGPRIRSFDEPPKPVELPKPPRSPRPKPHPDDLVDPAGLVGRLVALCDALDDMPKQVQRYARWRARRAAGQTRRFTPIRGLLQENGHPSGRLPGGRAVPVKPGAKRPKRIRDIDEVLDSANYLAWNAMRPLDTS